jgi:hypothetical protein
MVTCGKSYGMPDGCCTQMAMVRKVVGEFTGGHQNRSSSVICLTISWNQRFNILVRTREIVRERTVFATVCANSSKLSFPSPSLSASMMVLSTICCSC